jgi:hypothetical protein
MPVLPIAAFLAGALLTLLLPTLLLIALVVWYWVAVVRVHGPAEPPDTGPAATPATAGRGDPGQTAPPGD